MSYLLPSTGDRFWHATFLDECNSLSAYCNEVQPRYNYNQYDDERLAPPTAEDYNNCSSFAIHQLLELAARTSVNSVATSQPSDRQHAQQFMTSHVDDVINTSDSACCYGNAAINDQLLGRSKNNLYRRSNAVVNCCNEFGRHRDVISREYQQPGSYSYDRIRHNDDLHVTSCDEVRRRHNNYLTAIG